MQAATKAQVPGIGENGAVLAETASAAVEGRGQKVRAMLKARLGDEIYSSWFKSLEFESFDGRIVKVSVPVKFVRNWIQEHYADHLLACSRIEFTSAERVDVIWRQPGSAAQRAGEARAAEATAGGAQLAPTSPQAESPQRNIGFRVPAPPAQRTSAGGFEGSPLDPRYTFDSFVVGAVEPHGARRRDAGCRDGDVGRARLQSALSPFRRRSRQERICCMPSPGRSSGALRRPRCSI